MYTSPISKLHPCATSLKLCENSDSFFINRWNDKIYLLYLNFVRQIDCQFYKGIGGYKFFGISFKFFNSFRVRLSLVEVFKIFLGFYKLLSFLLT